MVNYDLFIYLLLPFLSALIYFIFWPVITWLGDWRIPVSPKKQKITNLIRSERIVLWAGVLSTGFFLVLIIILEMFPNETSALWITLMFALFIVMGIFLILFYCNIRIVLSEEHFTYRTFFRRTYKLTYHSVKQYKITNRAIILYTNKKKYKIDTELMVGIDVFQKRIEAQVGLRNRVYSPGRDRKQN